MCEVQWGRLDMDKEEGKRVSVRATVYAVWLTHHMLWRSGPHQWRPCAGVFGGLTWKSEELVFGFWFLVKTVESQAAILILLSFILFTLD